jgi:hypothetical protein
MDFRKPSLVLTEIKVKVGGTLLAITSQFTNILCGCDGLAKSPLAL